MATATKAVPSTNRFQVLVESVCRSLDQGQPPTTEDFRQLMTQVQTGIQAALPGGQWPVAGGTKATGGATPTGISLSVTGANGAFNVAHSSGSNAQGKTVWYEVSYSPLKSFTQQITTLPATTSPSFPVNAPGQTLFFRSRQSFDQVNWTPYVTAASTAVSSGLVSSTATSNAGAFNQTNYGVVTSAAVGSTADVLVQGASGPLTSLVAQKGPVQSSLPGATIAGVTPGSTQFVGYDGSKYMLRSTLADLLSNDDVTPIGKVSVVDMGTPTLPTITPIIVSGAIIAATWTGDNGLTAPPTLTVTDPGGPGTGAVLICSGVSAGKMTGIQVLNPGQNYDGRTTITASGGIDLGTPGGGTAVGGNGGRLTAV